MIRAHQVSNNLSIDFDLFLFTSSHNTPPRIDISNQRWLTKHFYQSPSSSLSPPASLLGQGFHQEHHSLLVLGLVSGPWPLRKKLTLAPGKISGAMIVPWVMSTLLPLSQMIGSRVCLVQWDLLIATPPKSWRCPVQWKDLVSRTST